MTVYFSSPRVRATGLYSLTLLMILAVFSSVFSPAHAADPFPSAFITVDTPGNSINGSTYNTGSLVITNTGNTKIKQVVFDLSTTLLPEIVFDPYGTAGDLVAKDFTPDSSTGTVGYQAPSSPAIPFNMAYKGGYRGLTLNFNGFDSNESFSFSVDIDPTSIKGFEAPGPGESGSISGLELIGATVRVTFDNNATHTGYLYFKSGTLDASHNAVSASVSGLEKPQLRVIGLQSPVTVRNPQQVARVLAANGTNVSLLIIEAAMYTPVCNGCSTSTYGVNSAVKVTEKTGTTNSEGRVDFNLSLTRSNNSAGFNYMVAVVKNGNGSSTLSTPFIVKYDPNANVNTAPKAVDDSYTINEDNSLNANVLNNDSDADADTLTVTPVAQPSHGNLSLNSNSTFTYTPSSNYGGADSFTYQANDGHGGTTNATVNITIEAVNDSPDAQPDFYTTFKGVGLRVRPVDGVLVNDSDVDDSPEVLTAALSGSPSSGEVVVENNGAFNFVPAPEFTGAVTFNYTVMDDENAASAGVVTVMVLPAQDDAELVSNGGFEGYNKTTFKPNKWQVKRLNKDRVRCNLVNRPKKPDVYVAHQGDCAFRFVGEPIENSLIQQEIPIAGINPGDDLQLIVYVQGKNVVPDAAKIRIIARYSDQPNQNLVIQLPGGTYPYTQLSDTLDVGEQLKKLRIMIQYLKQGIKGNFLVDFVSLRKLTNP